MRGRDVFDEVFGPDEVADAPACGVEVLAAAADCERQAGDFMRQVPDPCEGDVVQAVVDFVAEDYDVVFDAQVADGLALFFGEDFAHGVVRGVEHDHARAVGDGSFEFFHVEFPVAGGGGFLVAVFGWVERHVDDFSARHFDVGDVLVEEGLEDDYFVARFDEAHEC